MPYASPLSSTHWAAATTSLTSDSSLASAVRSDTMLERGAAPGYADDAPAAMPATIVPWPKSSPVAFGSRDERFTCRATRVPKSAARVASTPESITAIAGVCASDADSVSTPADACQRFGPSVVN